MRTCGVNKPRDRMRRAVQCLIVRSMSHCVPRDQLRRDVSRSSIVSGIFLHLRDKARHGGPTTAVAAHNR